MTLRSSLCVLSLVALACRPAERAAPAGAAAATPAVSAWLTVADNDSLRVSIDTTRLEQTERGVIVWIAMQDVTTAERRVSTSPFLRFEAQQQLDCAHEVKRGIQMRTPDSTGRVFNTPVRDQGRKPFDGAGLPRHVLDPVCRALASRRG